MKAGQFTTEQIVAILQEATRGEQSITALCREKGISEATFYAWRQKFGAMKVREAQRLKELEKENARLKKHAHSWAPGRPRPGDRLLEGGGFKKLVSAPQQREAAKHLVETGRCSQRQACRIVGLWRSTANYQARRAQARRAADEAELVEQLHRFAKRRRRRGYRLAHQELRRSGRKVNHKRVYRLWKREKLNVPPRKKRRRVRQNKEAAPRPLTATAPNTVWCLEGSKTILSLVASYVFCA